MRTYKRNHVIIILIAFLMLFNFNCNSQEIKKNLIGNWETENTKISIRTKIKWMKYKFNSANIKLTLKINSDNSVNGSIGDVKINQPTILKNKGKSSKTGIAYIIPCGIIGQICKEDTSALKTLELWIKPQSNEDVLIAEIRLKNGWDTFPMGEAIFYKK